MLSMMIHNMMREEAEWVHLPEGVGVRLPTVPRGSDKDFFMEAHILDFHGSHHCWLRFFDDDVLEWHICLLKFSSKKIIFVNCCLQGR